jgi:hypothetical protein
MIGSIRGRQVLLLFPSCFVRNESDFKMKELLGAAIYEGVKPMIVSEITPIHDVINSVGGGAKLGILNRLGVSRGRFGTNGEAG